MPKFFSLGPFDEARYWGLLEGLEASEVLLSYALRNNEVFRFDSNYFQKQFLKEEKAIRGKSSKTLAELGVDLRSFGAYSLNNEVRYLEQGVPFIRGVNMKNGRILFSDLIYISEEANALLWKSEVKPGMVLLSMSGTIGDVAIASKSWKYPINSNQDIAKIETNGNINPYFLYVFLLTKFGQNYLKREARGSVQQHVFLSQIEQFNIPIFSESFQAETQRVVEKSELALNHAESSYSQAETLLLAALSLADFSPSTENTNIKSLRESFGFSGRLDAEAYQPKYDQLRDLLYSYAGGVTTINELAGQIANGAEVREYQDEGIAYLRVGDVKNLTIDASSVVRINPASAAKGLEKIDLQAGDVLVSRSGSLAVTAVMEPEWADALISSHLIRLRITDERIDPYYLALFLSTKPGKMQIQQRSNGGVQPEINQPALKSILVPIPPQSIQQEIRQLILSARKLRDSSNNLLDVAKRAVEIAIEQDEQAALDFIGGQGCDSAC